MLAYLVSDSMLHAPILDWPAFLPCCTGFACIGTQLFNGKTQGIDVDWSASPGSKACCPVLRRFATAHAEVPNGLDLSFIGLFLPFHIQIGSSQAYARKLASCFVELTKTDSPSDAPAQITRNAINSPALVCGAAANSPTRAALHSPALEKLRMWTKECSSLRAFLAVSNIKKYLAFISHRLDGRPGLRTCDPNDKQNHDMLVCFDLLPAASTAASTTVSVAA